MTGLFLQGFRAFVEISLLHFAINFVIILACYVFQLKVGLMFVCDSRDNLMLVSSWRHNTEGIITTILVVDLMKFFYRGRIAVFSMLVLRERANVHDRRAAAGLRRGGQFPVDASRPSTPYTRFVCDS